jgi:hypothetical protein
MSPVVTFLESKGGREVLTLVVLLVLAVLWAVVLLPPLLRSRMTSTRSVDSIGDFNHKLGVLGRTNPSAMASAPMLAPPAVRTAPLPVSRRTAHAPMPPRTGSFAPAGASQRAAKRRGDVLRVLVVATALTMALAYFTGSSLLWGVQLLTDLALAAFLGLWAWTRSVQAERAEKVRFLPQQRRAPELALRRTASS